METGFWENPNGHFTYSVIDPSSKSSIEYYRVRSLAWINKEFRDIMHSPGVLAEVLERQHGVSRALHSLVRDGHDDNVAHLIHGRCSGAGRSAIESIISQPCVCVWEAMWMACDHRPTLVKLFLDAGFPVDGEFETIEQDVRGNYVSVNNFMMTTALVEAATAPDNVEVIQLLLDYGADVNWGGEEDNVPLQFAVKHLHVNNVVALLEGGADPNYEFPSDFHIMWDLLNCITRNEQELEDKKAIAIALMRKGGTFNLKWVEMIMEEVNDKFDPDLPGRVANDDFLGQLLDFAASAGLVDMLDDPRVRKMVWMDMTERTISYLRLCLSQAEVRGYSTEVIDAYHRILNDEEWASDGGSGDFSRWWGER